MGVRGLSVPYILSSICYLLPSARGCRNQSGWQGRGMAKARTFNVVIEQDAEGYYVASVPDLPGCHTQAKSLDTLMKRIREVIELCLEDQQDHEGSASFIGVQRIQV